MQDDFTRMEDVDIAIMRERYGKERNKRIRSEGTDQFIYLDGQFAEFACDPYAGAPAERDFLSPIALSGLFGPCWNPTNRMIGRLRRI